jgi:putative ABC transport system ATP-binding protein
MSEKSRRAAEALYGEAAPPADSSPEMATQAAGVEPLAHAPGDSDEHIIHVRGLRRRYRLGKDNFVDALRGASLDIRRGEMAAIMGPSGSGKSTMMHIIGCLDAPDAGEVWLSGRRVDTVRGRALTRVRGREIGFIFQGFNLIPTLNAIDNVSLAAEYAGVSRTKAIEKARLLLELVGLGDRVHHSPSELSGGQQQRVAIARALINDPTIILGDEPTGDLDTVTSEEIVATMRRINAETGTTFVLVTHNPEVAEACDRIIRMRDGVVVDFGEHARSGVPYRMSPVASSPSASAVEL